MKSIDETLIKYAEAYLSLRKIVNDRVKGDWNKIELLIENDDNANELVNGLFEQMNDSLSEFTEATSLGQLFTYSDGLQILYDLLEKVSSSDEPRDPIEWGLEQARETLEALMSSGEGDYRVKAIDQLDKIPNFAPDDWLSRKYIIKGIYLPSEEKKSHCIWSKDLRKPVILSFMAISSLPLLYRGQWPKWL